MLSRTRSFSAWCIVLLLSLSRLDLQVLMHRYVFVYPNQVQDITSRDDIVAHTTICPPSRPSSWQSTRKYPASFARTLTYSSRSWNGSAIFSRKTPSHSSLDPQCTFSIASFASWYWPLNICYGVLAVVAGLDYSKDCFDCHRSYLPLRACLSPCTCIRTW